MAGNQVYKLCSDSIQNNHWAQWKYFCQKVSFLYVFVIPNIFRIYQEGKARKIVNSMKHCLTTVKAFWQVPSRN